MHGILILLLHCPCVLRTYHSSWRVNVLEGPQSYGVRTLLSRPHVTLVTSKQHPLHIQPQWGLELQHGTFEGTQSPSPAMVMLPVVVVVLLLR